MATTNPLSQPLTSPGEKAIVAKAAIAARPGKKKLSASILADDSAIWYKILALAHSGRGKSRAIADLLRAGLRIVVCDTDIGGNGLSSVREDLKRTGEEALMQNLAFFEFSDYSTFGGFMDDPTILEIDGKNIWDWNPDVLAWEGFANWQEDHVTNEVLEMGGIAKEDSELREAGLWAERTDWGAIRRATLKGLNRFLRIHNPNGKKIHKYVTCLMDDGKQDKFTKETKTGPLIMGASRAYLQPAFDLILRMDAEKKPGVKDIVYSYKCDITGETVAKKRGLPVDSTEPADMLKLWNKITGKSA